MITAESYVMTEQLLTVSFILPLGPQTSTKHRMPMKTSEYQKVTARPQKQGAFGNYDEWHCVRQGFLDLALQVWIRYFMVRNKRLPHCNMLSSILGIY